MGAPFDRHLPGVLRAEQHARLDRVAIALKMAGLA